MITPENKIKNHARVSGFELVGIASAAPHPDISFYDAWLAKGFAATMDYLKRHREKKAEPQKILPGIESIICCGILYRHSQPASNPGFSSYCWGEDYHEVVKVKLEALIWQLAQEYPEEKFLSYVDTGPILERSYAASAGLGWIGKNTMLIDREQGSFFFLGEILTTLKLKPDHAEPDHCGTCTACLAACPTQALTPYELDASRCISYLTIEHRGEIPAEFANSLSGYTVGCDICQDVCPWNRQAPLSQEAAFAPRPEYATLDVSGLAEISDEEFRETFRNSPIRRVKPAGLRRNAKK